jgi:hypothetical protein
MMLMAAEAVVAKSPGIAAEKTKAAPLIRYGCSRLNQVSFTFRCRYGLSPDDE